MKLLYLASAEHPFRLPLQRSAGGIGTLEPILLDWLRERYDVDILCPADSDENDPYTGHVIRGRHISKEKSGRCDMVGRTRDLLEIVDNYDYIFCNDSRFSPHILEVLTHIARKFRMINHVTKQVYIQAFAVSQYQIHWVMAQKGAKVAHVQPTLDIDIQESLKSIEKNPYKIPGYGFGAFGDTFQHIDLLTTDERATEGELTCEDIWVTVGRAVPSKRMPLAYKAWAASGVPGELHIFAQDPHTKKSDLDELIGIAQSDPRVVLRVDAPQAEVFASLRRAKGSLFPSQYESMGLVAFESLCCGTPVIYSNSSSGHFLRHVPGNVRVGGAVKDWVKAIQSTETTLEDKKEVREQTRTRWSRERCKENIYQFIEG